VQPIRRAAQQSAAGTTAPRAYTFDQIATIMGQEMLVGTAPLLPLISIVGLVAAQSARIVCTGAGAGLVATFALTRIVRATGGAGSIFDPAPHVFVAPAAIVLLVAAVATWVPSRRAARI